ncbi:transcriptional activator spt7 [Coccidioides immitis RMSCC 3703]|uniref:SAGA complex subunit Spt7 n=1 Tax=Coccidioides immitis RMSCC 3703 TaxID=454286 RepID=A0A0J8R3E0_COCIT|nr:transcriptional activator spt7 [Coccidioides immitis RMSCC 3703]
MSLNQHCAWLPPGHLRPPDNQHNAISSANGLSNGPSRPRTPQIPSRANAESSQSGNLILDGDGTPEEDPRVIAFRESYKRTEAKINLLFSNKRVLDVSASVTEPNGAPAEDHAPADSQTEAALVPSRRPARKLDEDDYDEYDDEEDNEPESQAPPSPKSKSTPPAPEIKASPSSPPKPSRTPSLENQKEQKKDLLEDIRKKLEQDKKETEESAKRSFRTMFYTLENDRDAMLDQQRLEESERQVEAEMRGQSGNDNNPTNGQPGYGSLSSANLGASSLTLKNLIARIDMKRSEVQASDAELRSLMSEVRKNRSKWASEDKIGQEELYEAAEKVLSELKAMTEHSSAFLTRVNKRDAPDYYTIIKRPMDLGTMTKKLKALQYKSKQEFVDDLNLIWSNCLKYNTNPDHFLRKHALYMRKETEKLVPLIPDIVIRDRAEVEAEERRLQLAELDGAEESDDEPIMSSRGRKATATKGKKGAATGRKAPAKGLQAASSDTKNPVSDATSTTQDSTIEGIPGTLSTPPPGTLTPVTSNGQGAAATGSQMDTMDIDNFGLAAPAYNSALSGLGVDKFSKKMDSNMRQMQETRKICSKVSIVKQMQQQSQMYQNQFQKYQPEPLVEQDVHPHVMNDEGPVISPWVCRAALQRSVAKVLYHTGFEEYQPSALDAVTDIAADFFFKIGATLKSYMESPKVASSEQASTSSNQHQWKRPYTQEQMILHTLQSVGTDVETLESYVKDDVDRHGAKLGVIHERLKAHLAELLRPAFNDTAGDGSSAFNDGSEQFIGGDFAEDIDEDFFGFKELGLDKEFGLSSLSVPLHLLQNRMYHAHQAQNLNSSQAVSALFPTPQPYPRISLQTLPQHIGLVQNFFLAKLHANNDEPLVEDLELPPKQRPNAARPRVPASGKIPPLTGQAVTTSPQKRPAPPSSGITAIKSGLSEPSKKKVKKNPGTLGATSADGTDHSHLAGSHSPIKVEPASKLNGIKENGNPTDQKGDVNGVDGAENPTGASQTTLSNDDNMDVDNSNAVNGAAATASATGGSAPNTTAVNGHV